MVRAVDKADAMLMLSSAEAIYHFTPFVEPPTSTVVAVYAFPSQTRWSWHRRTVQPSATRDRAFPVAASRAWNDLLSSVTAASSLSTFRQELKTLAYTFPVEFSVTLHRLVSYDFWHCI